MKQLGIMECSNLSGIVACAVIWLIGLEGQLAFKYPASKLRIIMKLVS